MLLDSERVDEGEEERADGDGELTPLKQEDMVYNQESNQIYQFPD